MQIRGSYWIVRTLLWAVALGVTWYFIAHIYGRLLGNFVYQYLPDGIFMLLHSQVFFIGLGHPNTLEGPHLEIMAHNFGFGLVVTGAVVLGTQGRSWALRSVALSGVWFFLFLTHALVVVWGAKGYLADFGDDGASWVTSLYSQGVHPTMIVLPLLVAVIWLLLPSEWSTGHSRYTARLNRRARPGSYHHT